MPERSFVAPTAATTPITSPTTTLPPNQQGCQESSKKKVSHQRQRRQRPRPKRRSRADYNKVAPWQQPANVVAVQCKWTNSGSLKRVVVTDWKNFVILDKTLERSKNLRQQVAHALANHVIVGHKVEHLLRSLHLLEYYPWTRVRDCAYYPPFMRHSSIITNQVTMESQSVEELAAKFLQRDVRNVNDPLIWQCRALMDLYRSVKVSWDEETALQGQPLHQQQKGEMIIKEWIPFQSYDHQVVDSRYTHRHEAHLDHHDEKSIQVLDLIEGTTADSDCFLFQDDTSATSSDLCSIWKPPSLERTATGSSVSSWGLWFPTTEDPPTIDTGDFPELLIPPNQGPGDLQEKYLLPHSLLDECVENEGQ